MTRAIATVIGTSVLAAAVVATPALGAVPSQSGAGGFVMAIRATSITVGSTTCTRARSSPAVTGFRIGDRAAIECRNGVLTTIHHQMALRAGDRGGMNGITALGSGSVTFGHSIECSIGPSSPSLRSYRVGDRVQYRCRNGVLVDIEHW